MSYEVVLKDERSTSNIDGPVKSQGFAIRVIPVKAGIQLFQIVLDAGSVIPDLIRDRHDGFGTFYGFINIQRRTSNNDVAALRHLVLFVYDVCFF